MKKVFWVLKDGRLTYWDGREIDKEWPCFKSVGSAVQWLREQGVCATTLSGTGHGGQAKINHQEDIAMVCPECGKEFTEEDVEIALAEMGYVGQLDPELEACIGIDFDYCPDCWVPDFRVVKN